MILWWWGRDRDWDLNNFEFLNLFSKSYQRTDSPAIDPRTKGDSKNHIHFCEQWVIILVCCIYWYIKVISLHYIRLHPLYTVSWKSNTITLMLLLWSLSQIQQDLKTEFFILFLMLILNFFLVTKIGNYIQIVKIIMSRLYILSKMPPP